MAFETIVDIRAADTLAEAQLLWFAAPFTKGITPYKYSGNRTDLPSSHTNGYSWKYYVLLEE